MIVQKCTKNLFFIPTSNHMQLWMKAPSFVLHLPRQWPRQLKKLHLMIRALQILKNKSTFFLRFVELWKKKDEEFDTFKWRNFWPRLKHWIFQLTPRMKPDRLFFLFYFPFLIFCSFSTFLSVLFDTSIGLHRTNPFFSRKNFYSSSSTSYI